MLHNLDCFMSALVPMCAFVVMNSTRGSRERQGAKLNLRGITLSPNAYLEAPDLVGLMGLLTLFQVLGL